MRLLVVSIFSLFHLANGQEIFNSFGLDGDAKYLGETIYQFETDKDALLVLNAHNIKGDIEIFGEPGNAVQIVERIEISSRKIRWAEKEYELSRSEVLYDEVNGMIKIVGSGRWSSKVEYEYDIHIPKHTSVQLINQGGDISCQNIAGEIDIQTAGGDIELQQIAGKINAITSGGDVELSHAHGNIKLLSSGGNIETNNTEGVIYLETSGGDLDIQFNLGYVEVYTYGGKIRLNGIEGQTIIGKTQGGDIEIDEITANVDMQTDGGDFEISHIVGNVRVATSAGDIDIEHIIGNVNMETMVGSIQGDHLGGQIKAVTNVGDIIIHKSTHDQEIQDIELINNFGDVYLILPEHFSAKFDIRIDGNDESEVLETEYPLNIKRDGMILRATGIHGTGQHNVSISSHFGDVTITKD